MEPSISFRSVTLQCRQVKITILGEEGVPVQVDGEAWIQPPGIVKIVHKNRAQMLTRDRVRPRRRSSLHSLIPPPSASVRSFNVGSRAK